MFKLVPVLSASLSQRNQVKKYGKYVPFYPGAPETIDRLLINYAHIMRRKEIKREWFTKDMKMILADSGGLQGTTQGLKLTPRKVMEWQNTIADIAVGLDVIPVRRPKDGNLTVEQVKTQQNEYNISNNMDFFRKCARKTAENLNEAMKVKEEKVKLFAPIHGVTYNQRSSWLKEITKDHSYEGFTLKGSSLSQALTACAFMWDNITTPVHILGIGMLGRSAPFCYWSRHWKRHLTADSTSWDQGAFYRRWVEPITGDVWEMKNAEEKWEEKKRRVIWTKKRLPCTCKWCNIVRKKGFKFADPEFGILMSSHNLGVILERQQRLQALNIEPKMFAQVAADLIRTEESVDGPKPLSIEKVCEALDKIPEKGGEWVAERYSRGGKRAIEGFF